MTDHATDKNSPSVIVLVIDRLTAASLGPYGNTSIDTPTFNDWGASGILFDHVVANSIELERAYDSYWQGNSSWFESVANSTLLTDETMVASHSASEFFDEVQLIEQDAGDNISAASKADTQLASFFAQATAAVSNFQPGELLWLHSRGMSGLWDAPHEYRQLQCGPDDPAPPDFVRPPSRWIDPSNADPDLLLGFEQAYAAQVLVLDQLLGVLTEILNQDARFADTWLVMTSPRGYSLGQHGIVGDEVDPNFSGTTLHQENLHVPLVIHPPAKRAIDFLANRCNQVFGTNELKRILESIFNGQVESRLSRLLDRFDDSASSQCVVSQNHQATAIQTRQWKLITDGQQNRLYAKPDDRWEVNDVADRCPSEIAGLLKRLKRVTG